MFCSNCGKEVQDGQKFCSSCGTPVGGNAAPGVAPEENPLKLMPDPPAAPEPPHPFEDGASAGNGAAPPPPPPPPGSNGGGNWTPPQMNFNPGQNRNSMEMVLRVVAGIMAVIFIFSALGCIPALFRNIFGHFNLFYILANLVQMVAAVLMFLTMLAVAVRWKAEYSDFVFIVVVVAALARLASWFFGVIGGLISYHVFIGFGALRNAFGYIFCAGVLFGLAYLLGCPPLLGKTTEAISSSFSEGAKNLLEDIREMLSGIGAKRDTHTGYNPTVNPNANANPNPNPNVNPNPNANPNSNPAQGGNMNYNANPNGGYPPYSGYGPIGGGQFSSPKKTDRSLVVLILLNLVTCGIYNYIFIYDLSNDMNDICQGDGEKTGGLLAFILLGFLTCGIYQLVWYYKICNRMAANAPRYGVYIKENGSTFLLWYLLGSLLCYVGSYIAVHVMIKNANTLCMAYNRANGWQ